MAKEPRRVLVVENERDHRILLQESLRRSGYEAITVPSAEWAIEVLGEHYSPLSTFRSPGDIHAILCDINLVGLSGIDLYRTILGTLRHKIPFAFITQNDKPGSELTKRCAPYHTPMCFAKGGGRILKPDAYEWLEEQTNLPATLVIGTGLRGRVAYEVVRNLAVGNNMFGATFCVARTDPESLHKKGARNKSPYENAKAQLGQYAVGKPGPIGRIHLWDGEEDLPWEDIGYIFHCASDSSIDPDLLNDEAVQRAANIGDPREYELSLNAPINRSVRQFIRNGRKRGFKGKVLVAPNPTAQTLGMLAVDHMKSIDDLCNLDKVMSIAAIEPSNRRVAYESDAAIDPFRNRYPDIIDWRIPPIDHHGKPILAFSEGVAIHIGGRETPWPELPIDTKEIRDRLQFLIDNWAKERMRPGGGNTSIETGAEVVRVAQWIQSGEGSYTLTMFHPEIRSVVQMPVTVDRTGKRPRLVTNYEKYKPKDPEIIARLDATIRKQQQFLSAEIAYMRGKGPDPVPARQNYLPLDKLEEKLKIPFTPPEVARSGRDRDAANHEPPSDRYNRAQVTE